MRDIIFKTEEYVFSYRVAGILIYNDKILLQKIDDDTAYAIPGGHVNLGETNEEALIREFKEEINSDIKVNDLMWVGELFFPWGEKQCHQICIYYNISLNQNTNIPFDGIFYGKEELEEKSFELKFSWVNIKDVENIDLYPIQAQKYILEGMNKTEHFVYKD